MVHILIEQPQLYMSERLFVLRFLFYFFYNLARGIIHVQCTILMFFCMNKFPHIALLNKVRVSFYVIRENFQSIICPFP